MKWRRLFSAFIVGLTLAVSAGTAQACPMCKEANESNDRRPQAYMYSILFMLAVPATVATGFGIGFYRLAKKQRELNGPLPETDPDDRDRNPFGESP